MSAAIRRQVFSMWRGPGQMAGRSPDRYSFLGWQVFSLDIVVGWPETVESRIVYADPYDDAQRFALVRAVAWRRSSVREKPIAIDNNADSPMAIPARIVYVDMELIRNFLTAVPSLQVHLTPDTPTDPDVSVRRLRIEWNYATSVFERIWQPSGSPTSLDNYWSHIWQELGLLLESHRQTLAFREIYQPAIPSYEFDFTAYKPIF